MASCGVSRLWQRVQCSRIVCGCKWRVGGPTWVNVILVLVILVHLHRSWNYRLVISDGYCVLRRLVGLKTCLRFFQKDQGTMKECGEHFIDIGYKWWNLLILVMYTLCCRDCRRKLNMRKWINFKLIDMILCSSGMSTCIYIIRNIHICMICSVYSLMNNANIRGLPPK